jgi:hypothetical protein
MKARLPGSQVATLAQAGILFFFTLINLLIWVVFFRTNFSIRAFLFVTGVTVLSVLIIFIAFKAADVFIENGEIYISKLFGTAKIPSRQCKKVGALLPLGYYLEFENGRRVYAFFGPDEIIRQFTSSRPDSIMSEIKELVKPLDSQVDRIRRVEDMDNYYLLTGEDTSQGTIALAPGIDMAGYELIRDLGDATELPFDFTLKAVRVGRDKLIYSNDFSGIDNIWSDYQPNAFARLLMSAKMRHIIDANLTGRESIDWIACRIKHEDEERIYYMLRFNKPLDVLNEEKTVFVKGTDRIIKPVFKPEKIRQYNVFHQPAPYDFWRIPPAVYVAESVKRAVEEAKLIGIQFNKTLVA